MSEIVVPIRRIEEESIITGEAVELEIHPASPVLRIGAAFVDMATIILVGVLYFQFTKTLAFSLSHSMLRVYALLSLLFFTGVLPLSVEIATGGRSLGKWAFGLRVVRDDGGMVTGRHSMTRVIIGLVECWTSFGVIALLTMMVSARSKRLGDIAAGTMVIRLPEPVEYDPLVMPPDYALWASHAQVLPLPQQLHYECLHFMRHNRMMRPEVRHSTGIDLAERVSAYVSPRPGSQADHERFLAAVLVILRDREYARYLRRDEASRARRARLDSSSFGM